MAHETDAQVQAALTFIQQCLTKYDKLAVVSSFGKDSMVMLHMVRSITPDILVLWIKPPFLPQATITFANSVIDQWKLRVKTVISEKETDTTFMQRIVYEPRLWKTNPELCCQLFKVEPIKKAVNDLELDGWFSGMRKTESEKRGMYTQVWKQGPFVKLHPIIHFTEADVWRYSATRQVPIHPWYRLGYRSLGCEPCSFPNVFNSERGGRWKDTMMEGGDCGIHCQPMRE
jgi:phosphoadenosine phosphosulfate reductase